MPCCSRNRTRTRKRILAVHYLARLEDGFRIVYLGPFEDSGTAVLGS